MPPYKITLADGSAWVIAGGDEQAEAIVARLGAAMQLEPRRPDSCALHRLLFVSDQHALPAGECADVVRVLRPAKSDADRLYTHLVDASLTMARELQRRGGVLLHGALAVYPAASAPAEGLFGVIFAAPGGIGKTTASNRLPPPWRSLCDDTTLVVRDGNGGYRAHPWPTWSRFAFDGPGGSWDTQQSAPLRAIFILVQARDERVEPVGAGHAVTLLLESAEQVSHPMAWGRYWHERRALRLERLDNLCALIKVVPVYTLQLSLTGAFWEHIEQVINDEG